MIGSLRLTAAADLRAILEVDSAGPGWPITLTDPDGNVGSFTGLSGDIAQVIDPETGQAVSGRFAHVAIPTATIREKLPGSGLPQGIADTKTKPWVVEFDDIDGLPYKFKVSKSNPDRTLGLVSLTLEIYE